MPLIRSTSNKARQENIREMIAAGHKPDQAVAASYRMQREMRAKKKAKGGAVAPVKPAGRW